MADNGLTLPAFPTEFSDKEAARLKELETQKTQMEKVYTTKFSPDAWSKVSVPEKATREMLSQSTIAPLVKAITPWQWGFDYGMTPEQFYEESDKLAVEYKELARKEKVVQTLPVVMEALRNLALSGEGMITDSTQLNSVFKLDKFGFTDAEKAYVAQYAMQLTQATPEQLANGDVGAINPITDEDLAYLSDSKAIEPQYILSTVAFSKNVQQISDALKGAYPPNGVDVGVATAKEKIINKYVNDLNVAGTPTKDKTLTDATSEHFDKIANTSGQIISIVDNDAGTVMVGSRRDDGSIWVNGILFGYADEGGNIRPPAPDGKPLPTEDETKTGINKFFSNFGLSLVSGTRGTWESISSLLKSALPRYVSSIGDYSLSLIPIPTAEQWEDASYRNKELPASIALEYELYSRSHSKEETMAFMIEKIEAQNRDTTRLDVVAKARYEEGQANLELWFEEHPQYYKPEYLQDPIEHTELLSDPGWWGYTIGSALPQMVAAIAVTVGVTGLSGNPVAGAAAGAAMMTPLEMSQVYDEMLANGANPGQAASMAGAAGTAIGSMEIIPGLIYAKTVAPALWKIFRKNLIKEASKLMTKRLAIKGAIVAGTQLGIAETMEEVFQEAAHNAVIKTVDENHDILENLPSTALTSFVSFLPFTVLGMGGNYYGMKPNLSKTTQNKIDNIAKTMKDAGLSDGHAEAVAFAKILETEEGQAEVRKAMDAAQESIPTEETIAKETVPESVVKPTTKTKTTVSRVSKTLPNVGDKIVDKISSLYDTVDKIQSDIDVFESSIERLMKDKEKQPFDVGISKSIASVKANLADLQDTKVRKLEALRRLKEALVRVRTAEEAPIVEEAPTREQVTVAMPNERRNQFIDEANGLLVKEGKTEPNSFYSIGIPDGEALIKTDSKGKALAYAVIRYREDKLVADLLVKAKGKGAEGRAAVDEIVSKLLERGAGLPEAFEMTPDAQRLVDRKVSELRASDNPEAKARWESYSRSTKEAWVKKAGIAKTSLNKSWDELTNVQQQLLAGVKVLRATSAAEAPTGIPNINEPPPNAYATGTEPLPLGTIPDLTFSPSQMMPRLPNLEIELARYEHAVRNNPSIQKLIHVNEKLNNLNKMAGEVVNKLQDDLKQAREAGDDTTADGLVKTLQDAGRRSGLGKDKLLTDSFSDLPPISQAKVVLALMPDHSISSAIVDEFRDTALVLSSIEKETGLPFLSIFERIETTRGFCMRLQDRYLKEIIDNPKWKKIISNPEYERKIALILDSRREGSKTVVEPPITEEDFRIVEIADAMEAKFKMWQPVVRFMRFMEAYEADNSAKSIMAKIPNAPIEDIKQAIDILEKEGEDAVWAFLGTKTWGVIDSGYSPWKIAKPGLEETEPKWTTVRGAGYLMSRDSTTMPWSQETGLFRRFDAYNLSMSLRFFLRNEVKNLADVTNVAWDKWTKPEHVQNYLRKYLRAVQGFPEEEHVLLKIMRKMQSWAYPNIFWHPWIGIRNVVQMVWSYPYRTELIRSLWESKKLPASLKFEASEIFATKIDQSGRPLRAFMFAGERVSVFGEIPQWLKTVLIPTKIVTKPLDFLAAQTTKIPTIAFTDKASRASAYYASLNKAWRATEQYMKDNNAKKWFDNSGLNNGYITNEQQAHILGLLALGEHKVSWAIPGLTEISGYHAAAIRIAEETTNRTLYLYDRAIAAGVHRGSGGRTLGSLLVFPRSTIQMYAMQFAKVLSKTSSPLERLAATKNIVLLWLVGDVLSSALMTLSGRRRKEYTLINTITWQFGGLSFGIARDATTFLNDMLLAAAGDEVDKQRVLSALPQEASRLGDVLVGFYRITFDTLEALTDEKAGLDIRYMRKIRAFFDKTYTPQEQDKAERTIVEAAQKIIMGSEAPDPIVFEKAQDTLKQDEDKLGTISAIGQSYTLQQFGGDIDKTFTNIPDFLVIEEAGWSDLVMFHAQCSDAWKEYDELPTTPSKIREDWRLTHPEEEAMMLFWGKLSKSINRRGSTAGNETMTLLRSWWDRYGITSDKRPKADWLDGGAIVEE